MAKYTLFINKKTQARSIRINKTSEIIQESIDPSKYLELRKKTIINNKAKRYRMTMDYVADITGLTKVYGAVSGKIYYE